MSLASIESRAPGELVSSWVDAINGRDLDGMLGYLDRDVDFRPLKLTGLDRSYRGHDGVRRWFEQVGQRGYDCRLDIDDIDSVAGGSVVTMTGTLCLEPWTLTPFSAIHRIAGGQILSARQYFSDLELIERLGLVA